MPCRCAAATLLMLFRFFAYLLHLRHDDYAALLFICRLLDYGLRYAMPPHDCLPPLLMLMLLMPFATRRARYMPRASGERRAQCMSARKECM